MKDKLDFGYSATTERFSKWINESIQFLDSDLNETDTRCKVIDPLFKDVMGWDEKYIKREGHLNQIGYYDYEFVCSENKFIFEAKREQILFDMPKDNIVQAKTLNNSKHSKLYEAIKQGVDYAVPRRIDVVVVSNGIQIAVTYVPYFLRKINDTYLFHGHKKIQDDFISFYNLFSPYQNIKETIAILLSNKANRLIRNRPPFSPRLSQKQNNPDDILANNPLASFLSSIHDKYFTEIISNWDLLKKCYCDYESAHQYEKNIELILRDRAPRLSKVVQEIIEVEDEDTSSSDGIKDIITSKKTADVFDERFSDSKNRSKMFLLIGGAGVGKTTFIHRFFNFILSEEDRNSTAWIYLDCKECAHGTDLDKFIYKKIEDELYEKYRHMNIFDDGEVLLNIFSKDLNKNKALLSLIKDEDQKNLKRFKIIEEITENDKETYIKRLFEYIQKQGYSTCIIYDNVDQLDAELQKVLFLHGNAIKERLRTTLILSLREEVYYQHEKDKTFNFSDCDVFHIPSPKVFNVISKRLKAVKDEFSEEDVLFNYRNTKGISVAVKKLDIVEVLTQTFLGNPDNTLLLEMISNGDVRESLKLFKKMISSPNVNYDELVTAAGVSSIKSTADKRIKYEELLRALALDNRVHYISSKSKIINIFEANNDGFFSHFTKLRILLYAQRNLSLKEGNLPKGFFKIEDMYFEFFRFTVNDIEVFNELCLFLQKEGALINLKGTITSLCPSDFVSLGPSGYYYLNNLMINPNYLALMAVDTSIADQKAAERIEDLYKKSLATGDYQKYLRYKDMANVFADYLVAFEEEEIKTLKDLSCPNLEDNLYSLGKVIRSSLH